MSPSWHKKDARRQVENIIKDYDFPRGALTLLRFGENATYQIEGADFVVRLSKPDAIIERTQKSLDVATHLYKKNVPTVVPCRLCGMAPVLYKEGYHFTLWDRITTKEIINPDWFSFGALLKQFHKAMQDFPDKEILPDNQVLSTLDQGCAFIKKDHSISDEDRAFIERKILQIQEQWEDFVLHATAGIMHGDAHARNILLSTGGVYTLCDYDYVSSGPLLWDLVPTCVEKRRLGLPDQSYQDFCKGYGVSEEEKHLIDSLAPIRELMMVLWLCQHKEALPNAGKQIRHRLDCLKRDDTTTAWNVY